MEKTVIDCRKTRFGADTTVVYGYRVEVKKFNQSASGHHWKESITWLTPGAYVLVRDISNTGKHGCYYLDADGSRKSAWEVDHCDCYKGISADVIIEVTGF